MPRIKLFQRGRKRLVTSQQEALENPLGHLLYRTIKTTEDLKTYFKSLPVPGIIINERIEHSNITYHNFQGLGVTYSGFPKRRLVMVGVNDGQFPTEPEGFTILADIAKKFGLSAVSYETYSSLFRKIFWFMRIKIVDIYSETIYINPDYKKSAELLEELGRELYGINL